MGNNLKTTPLSNSKIFNRHTACSSRLHEDASTGCSDNNKNRFARSSGERNWMVTPPTKQFMRCCGILEAYAHAPDHNHLSDGLMQMRRPHVGDDDTFIICIYLYLQRVCASRIVHLIH